VKKRYVFVVEILVFLYFLLIIPASLDNFEIVWKPDDLIEEYQYISRNLNKILPQITSSPPSDIKELVTESTIPAFQLIQQDTDFSYLAELVIKYKIPITRSSVGLTAEQLISYNKGAFFNAFSNSKGETGGKIYLGPPATSRGILFEAAIIVHELTHAYDHLENPDDWKSQHLSSEFRAFKNQVSFFHKYKEFSIASILDYFDRQDILYEYSLYKNIQRLYPNFVDDVQLLPKNKIEQLLHSIVSETAIGF